MAALLAIAALAACAKDDEPGLDGTLWRLESYLNADGETVQALPDVDVTATFDGGRLSGSAGCNQYGATYTRRGNQLTLELLEVTLMLCQSEPIMAQEGAYIEALSHAASYRVADDRLEIADADEQTVLTFVSVEPAPLVGTTWLLTWYHDGQGSLVSVLADSEITAQFGEDGQVAGSAGCNGYGASYTVEDDQLSVGPAAATLMLCADPAGIMEQEAAYLGALARAARYRITADELELLDDTGALVASYVAP